MLHNILWWNNADLCQLGICLLILLPEQHWLINLSSKNLWMNQRNCCWAVACFKIYMKKIEEPKFEIRIKTVDAEVGFFLEVLVLPLGKPESPGTCGNSVWNQDFSCPDALGIPLSFWDHVIKKAPFEFFKESPSSPLNRYFLKNVLLLNYCSFLLYFLSFIFFSPKCTYVYLTPWRSLCLCDCRSQPATRQDLLVYIALRVMTTHQNVQVPCRDAACN